MKKNSNILLAGGILFLAFRALKGKCGRQPEQPSPRFQIMSVNACIVKDVWLKKDPALRHIFLCYQFIDARKITGPFVYDFGMSGYRQLSDLIGKTDELIFEVLPANMEVVGYADVNHYDKLVMNSMCIPSDTLEKLISSLEEVYILEKFVFKPHVKFGRTRNSICSSFYITVTDKVTLKPDIIDLTRVPDVKNINKLNYVLDDQGYLNFHMNPCPPHDFDDKD